MLPCTYSNHGGMFQNILRNIFEMNRSRCSMLQSPCTNTSKWEELRSQAQSVSSFANTSFSSSFSFFDRSSPW